MDKRLGIWQPKVFAGFFTYVSKLTSHTTELYERVKGSPMGSHVSGLIADIVMQKLEGHLLPIINPTSWMWYVDNTVVTLKHNQVAIAHQLLNNTMRDIQFTMELGTENKLPFLEVLVARTSDGELQTSVNRKRTHTDQILNYHSNQPICLKITCVRTLFQRSGSHCTTTEAKREAKHLFKSFERSVYPRIFVRRCLNKGHAKTEFTSTTKNWIILQ